MLKLKRINPVIKPGQILSLVKNKAAYEGDGKTTVKILNQEQDSGLLVDTYGTFGFRLNNGITILGPIALFHRSVLSWQVDNSTDINCDSLSLFQILEPKIDLLVIGLETNEQKLVDSVKQTVKKLKVGYEVMPVEHAAATFNFLSAEGRHVAAALIPPLSISVGENDIIDSKMHYEKPIEKM